MKTFDKIMIILAVAVLLAFIFAFYNLATYGPDPSIPTVRVVNF